MDSVIVIGDTLRRMLSRIVPYAAIEIIVPGGTLLALLLYLHRRQRGRKNRADRMSIRRPVRRL